ncbi:MAG: porphobilinogen synthase [Desulfoplanes sp.]|nr:porphobilinogen synthase [Desulfoplanes sp.]MDD4649279.1 porphobilinogen synthase [Desulfoplanes sp.]
MNNTFYRGRRLRRTPALRDLVRETEIRPQDLIQPYFVVETDDPEFSQPISSMPGQAQYSLNKLQERVAQAVDLGLRALILFGIPKEKDPKGSQAYADTGIVQEAVRRLKARWPELVVITDVCMCEFTSHGHCGILENQYVQNDITLDYLAKTALSHARAGADMVAPSDMMDGRIQAIREALDKKGFEELPIMSYAVKSASSFYGPFREAAESAPAFGDRKSYQMDPANLRQAMCEAQADLDEGADILMVKPALPYLDVLRRIRDGFDVPTAAYQVSGEYSMIKAGAQMGWIDEQKIVMESLTSIKRAGADLIITYFAENVLRWMA